MKLKLSHLLLASALLAATAVSEDAPLRLALDLSDGSRVVGIPSTNSLSLRTSYASMTIPFAKIGDLEMSDDGEKAVITLANGDHLTAVPAVDSIELTTVFGKFTVGMEHIRRITVFSTGNLHRWQFTGNDLTRFKVTGPGTLAEKEGRVYASSYGNGNSWHGPRATFRTMLQGDFLLAMKVDYRTAGSQLGRITAGVILTSGETIRFGISDSHLNTVEHIFFFSQGKTSLWSSGVQATDRSFSEYPIEIRRRGNKIECVVGGTVKKTYTGCDTAPVKEVYFSIEQHQNRTPLTEAAIRELILRRPMP